ncbi:MAG: S-adenosylmethionine:tRNA ribosyltransferase-isomerase, partial [Chitinophagaceae bacterium]
MIPPIAIDNYNYTLPNKKIAYFPLNNREQSKLLVFQNNIIKDYFFYELPTILPPHTLLVCNNS